MKINLTPLISVLLFMIFSIGVQGQGKTFTSVTNDSWEKISTWDDGTNIPGPDDDVIIKNTVTLNLNSKITIASLTLSNENATEEVILKINGTDTLEVLNSVLGVSKNVAHSVDFQVAESVVLYVHGDFYFNRDPSNWKPKMLRFHLSADAKAHISGNFKYEYHRSNPGEENEEVVIMDSAILDISGLTDLINYNGNSLNFSMTSNAQATLRDSLTVLVTDGRGIDLIVNDDTNFQVLSSAYLSNTNGYQNANIKAAGNGTITIQKDITLEAANTLNLALLSAHGAGAKIDIQRDLILKSTVDSTVGIKLGSGGDLYLGGDITRPTDKGFLQMDLTSQVILNGSTPQSIPETTLPSSGQDSLCFTNITFQNTSGVPMELTGDLIVTDTLVLTSGKIKSSSSAIVTLENNAIIAGGDESNYIIGPVLKKGTADALFLPIGTATKYAPIEISEISNPAGEMTVTYYSDPPPFGTNYSIDSTTLNNISMIQHWQIQRTAGVEDLDYTLHWMDQTANGISDTSAIVVVGLEGTVYTSYGKESVNSNGTEGSVTNAFSDPPPFGTEFITIGSTKASNALPVELTKFHAVQQDQEVYLNWETATEIRTNHFEVQHAIDADNFKTIETIFAKGNSNTNQAYATVDKFPVDGMNYYRIKIVDIDGSFEYSQIQMVKFDDKETINIYPNPVDKEINIKGAEGFGKNATIKVFDTTGREVYSGEIQIEEGNFQISTDAINVNSRGTYLLQITSSSKTKDLKFIKIN